MILLVLFPARVGSIDCRSGRGENLAGKEPSARFRGPQRCQFRQNLAGLSRQFVAVAHAQAKSLQMVSKTGTPQRGRILQLPASVCLPNTGAGSQDLASVGRDYFTRVRACPLTK